MLRSLFQMEDLLIPLPRQNTKAQVTDIHPTPLRPSGMLAMTDLVSQLIRT